MIYEHTRTKTHTHNTICVYGICISISLSYSHAIKKTVEQQTTKNELILTQKQSKKKQPIKSMQSTRGCGSDPKTMPLSYCFFFFTFYHMIIINLLYHYNVLVS